MHDFKWFVEPVLVLVVFRFVNERPTTERCREWQNRRRRWRLFSSLCRFALHFIYFSFNNLCAECVCVWVCVSMKIKVIHNAIDDMRHLVSERWKSTELVLVSFYTSHAIDRCRLNTSFVCIVAHISQFSSRPVVNTQALIVYNSTTISTK